MEINSNYGNGIVATDIFGINNYEMKQMCELKDRIAGVLISHKPDSKEKQYISDNDLKLMHAILRVFTREYAITQTSAFDNELKAIDEEEKNMEKTSEMPQDEDDE